MKKSTRQRQPKSSEMFPLTVHLLGHGDTFSYGEKPEFSLPLDWEYGVSAPLRGSGKQVTSEQIKKLQADVRRQIDRWQNPKTIGRPPVTPEQLKEIKAYLAKGWKLQQIAIHYKVSRQAIQYLIKTYALRK